MNQSKIHAEAVCNSGCTLCAARIRTDNNGLLEVGDVLLDIPLQQRLAVQVVDRHIKEALVLWVVQVHGDDMIGTRARQQVGDENAGLGNPLLVARLGLEAIDECVVCVVVGGKGRRL